jgi:hypothetical protein
MFNCTATVTTFNPTEKKHQDLVVFCLDKYNFFLGENKKKYKNNSVKENIFYHSTHQRSV